MNKTIIWIVIVVLVLIGGWMLLSGADRSSFDDGEGPIRIGVIGPWTGDAAAYGEPMRNTVALAVAEINDAGGVSGRPLEAIYEDGQCSGTAAANATQKLVNVDKVGIILGGFCSSESLAAIPVAQKAGVFMVSAGSSSPDLTGISQWFARTWVSDAAQGGVLAEEADSRGWKKVAFILESLDYPTGIYNAFDTRFKELGGTTVKESFPSDTTDFRTALTKLRAENPDALFISVQTPAVAERILRQLQDLGWKPALMASDVVPGDAELVSRNAVLLEGTLGAEFLVDDSTTKFKDFIAKYVEQYGSEPPYKSSYTPNMYDTVFMIAEAVEEVGYNPAAVRDWFRAQTAWPGVSGAIGIDEGGDRVGGFVLKIIRNGRTEVFEQ